MSDADTALKTGGAELLSLGYRIVPIAPRQKYPGEYVSGRWKAMDTWQRWRDRVPTPYELSVWSKWPNANVGIVLGSVVDDATVVIAIDLDMTDEDTVRAVVAALPYTPMSKRGAKGETLFYRASPEIKTRAYNRPLDEYDANGKRKQERLADFLTGNHTRQTVAPPSLHPEGFEYQWLRGPVNAAELPIFTADDVAKFEMIMRDLGWDAQQGNAPDGITRAAPKPRQSAEVVPLDSSASVHKKLNKAALENLDAWVPELDLFKCQKARDGYEAVATWRASSSGRADEKRKRNLSIQPNGIQDFGASVNYSPIDLVMCARQTTFGDAYEWLRGFITPQDDSGVVLAFPEKPFTPKVRDADRAAPGVARAVTSVPVHYFDDADLDEWPDELCYPPGAVGYFAEWVDRTAMTPAPLLAYGAALTVFGTLAGRQFMGPTKSGTHLYVIGAAPTGAGKDHPIRCVQAAFHDANMAEYIGPPDYTSDTAILRHILDNPLSVSLMDEFGSIWKRINNRRAGTFEQAITRALREPWGRSFGMMRTKQFANAGPASQDIWHPALSILGMTTPDEFFSALSAADLENGMVNRLLVLATGRRGSDRRSREELLEATFSDQTQTALACPPTIIKMMSNVRDWQGDTIGPQFAWPADRKPQSPLVKVTADRDAKEALHSYKLWIGEKTIEDPKFGLFYSRGFESAVRVATIHAIGRAAVSDDRKTPPNIVHEDAVHAVRLIDWSLRRLWARIAEHETPESQRDVVRTVFRAIQRRGGKDVSRTDMRKGLHGVGSRLITDAVDELLEAGYLIAKEARTSPSQKKPSTVYSIASTPSWAMK